MLLSLAIRDFVIVERLELELAPGFTVFTGETGAGKSILIDALALVLGERADPIVVRRGAERAEIEAQFDLERLPGCARWLDERELCGDDAVCVLRRVIDAAGRSRGYINGRAVPLAQLREAGEQLVDIHGQHAHQSLVRPATQRELIDAYGGIIGRAARTAERYRAWEEARGRRLASEADAAALGAEREALTWRLEELESLGFTMEGWEAQQAEHARLAHAASLIEGAHVSLEVLSEGEAATLAQLNAAIGRLKSLSGYDRRLEELASGLEQAAIQVQEAVYSLRHYAHALEADPLRLSELESRLAAVHAACRKYRTSPAALPALLEEARGRLAELDLTADAEALERLEREAHAAWLAEARELSAERREAATRLSREVTAAMQTLAMAGGAFEAALKPAAAPTAHGLEQVEFQVAPHRGATVQPLAKVASGGELSRLSLAVQTVVSRVARVPTLVFDEVDAGIGGRVAEIVGRMLKVLGRTHQVMCITHLPQVAAAADHQWQVSKTSGSAVATQVRRLDRAARIEEIARMLGGVRITETTRRHAAEMLEIDASGVPGSRSSPGAAGAKVRPSCGAGSALARNRRRDAASDPGS
jgi:DNA repair protein RecN (Recombination protein N)